jgi:hypothetical protein
VVQWDREPEFDSDGNVIGFKDTMKVTPSHLLTREQTAQIRDDEIGGIEVRGLRQARGFDQLAKILGVAAEPQPQTVSSATVSAQQVNIGGLDSALESMRRIAFFR